MKPSALPKIKTFTSPAQSPTKPSFYTSSSSSFAVPAGPPPKPPQAVNIIPPTPVLPGNTGFGAAGHSSSSTRRSPLKAWEAEDEDEDEEMKDKEQDGDEDGAAQTEGNDNEVDMASSPDETNSPEEQFSPAEIPPPRQTRSYNRPTPSPPADPEPEPHQEVADNTTHEEFNSPVEESSAQMETSSSPVDVLSTSPNPTASVPLPTEPSSSATTHRTPTQTSPTSDADSSRPGTPKARDSHDTVRSLPFPSSKRDTLELPNTPPGPLMRMNSGDSVFSEGSGSESGSAGRGRGGRMHSGHMHRRSSSQHRVLETLNAQHHTTPSGQRMVNQYALGERLGSGAYGIVEIGRDVGTGVDYAIKEFSKSRLKKQIAQQSSKMNRRGRGRGRGGIGMRSRHFRPGEDDDVDDVETEKEKQVDEEKEKEKIDPLALIRREVAVMKKLDHPNIVLLYEAIDVPTSDSLYLVLEYMSGGTLIDVKIDSPPAVPYGEERARGYFRQLLLGLEYLHENDVAHRDIKPDNILLSEDRETVKLCDFGVSEMFAAGDDRIKTSAGSPAFMSPEAATSHHKQDIHARPTDIWALGVTLYCMVQGQLPFSTSNPLELYDAIKTAPVPTDQKWDASLRDLIPRMLEKDPMQRITTLEMKEHPWVTRNGEDPMPTTEENLYDIGQQVEEPSEEEITKAIGSIRSVFRDVVEFVIPLSTVIRAVQKLNRLRLNRRSLSGQGSQDATKSAPPATSIFSLRRDNTGDFPNIPSRADSGSQDAPTPAAVSPQVQKIEPDEDEVSSPGSITGASDHFAQSFGASGLDIDRMEASPEPVSAISESPPTSPTLDSPSTSAKRKWKERITSRVNSVDEVGEGGKKRLSQ